MRIHHYCAGAVLLVACAHGSSPGPQLAPTNAAERTSASGDQLGTLQPTPMASAPRHEPGTADPVVVGGADPAQPPPAPTATGAGQPAAQANTAEAPTRQESELRERIQRRLLRDRELSYTARRVRIEVNQSDVTLQGEVRTAREKSDVEQVIQQISGVRRVNNQLAVIDQSNPGAANGLHTR